MLSFEWTIKFGDVLTMCSAVIVAGAILYRKGQAEATHNAILSRLVDDFDEMKKEFKAFSSVLSEVALQKMQIELLMKWYDEFRRGVGLIKDRE